MSTRIHARYGNRANKLTENDKSDLSDESNKLLTLGVALKTSMFIIDNAIEGSFNKSGQGWMEEKRHLQKRMPSIVVGLIT